MKKEANKVIIRVSDATVTRLAKKYDNLNVELKITKEKRDETLDLLRDTVLSHFDPMDEDKTRVFQTPSTRVTVNKRTIRNVVKTDMEQVFNDIIDKYKIPKEELDAIVNDNTTVTETEIKPTVKVD